MRYDAKMLSILSLGCLTLFGLAACSGDGVSSPIGGGAGEGSVSVHMTDAEGTVNAAWVSVAEVYAEGPDGRVQLAGSSDGAVELTQLEGGSAVTLSSNVAVEADTYSEVHVVIEEAAVETRDGTVLATSANLQLPGASAAISGSITCDACGDEVGVRVRLAGGSFSVSGNSNTTLLLDFDVAESFRAETGLTGSGSWSVQPVIVGSEDDEEDETGAIAGTATVGDGQVEPFPVQCGGQTITEEEFLDQYFLIHATAQNTSDGEGGSYSRSTTADSAGDFRMEGLPTDDYSMDFEQRRVLRNGDTLDITAQADPNVVTVEANSTATANFDVGGATCRTGA